jgi:hypothetical protein
MTTSNKRSSITVSKSAIDQATQTLQGLPEKPKQGWSLREAIDQMNDVLSAAISKGYSYEELVDLLRDQGIEISVSSLKNYLTRSKRESQAASSAKAPTKATGKPRGRRPKSAQNAETQAGASAQLDNLYATDTVSQDLSDRTTGEAASHPSASETESFDETSPIETESDQSSDEDQAEIEQPTKKRRTRTASSRSKTVAKTRTKAKQAKVST